MNKWKKLSLVVFLIIVVVVLGGYVHRVEEKPAVPVEHEDPANIPEMTDAGRSIDSKEEQTCLQGEVVPVGPFDGLSLEEAGTRFRKLRNLTMGDPALSSSAKEREVLVLGEIYRRQFGDIPEETNEDLAEQARMEGLLLDYRDELEMLRNDSSLTREQRKEAVGEIVERYMQELE